MYFNLLVNKCQGDEWGSGGVGECESEGVEEWIMLSPLFNHVEQEETCRDF